jgi:multiple sugar transport system permease protein
MAQAGRLQDLPAETEHSRQPKRGFFSGENPFLWLLPGVGLLLIYAIFPLIYNLYVSFHEWNLMSKRFKPVGGENWKVMWDSLIAAPLVNLFTNPEAANFAVDPRIQNSLLITFQYVIIALALQLFFGMVIALLLDSEPWAAGLMQSVMILPMVIAPAIAGMMFRLLLHADLGSVQWLFYQVGITSPQEPFMGGTGKYALSALLMVDIWQWTPFFIIILLAGLKGLPGEILEASAVDGANFFQRLFRIKIPLLRKVILVAVLFRLVDLYRVYDYVHIMTSGGPASKTETLSYYTAIQTFGQLEWGYGATLSIVILLIAWLTAFLYQKFFQIDW